MSSGGAEGRDRAILETEGEKAMGRRLREREVENNRGRSSWSVNIGSEVGSA